MTEQIPSEFPFGFFASKFEVQHQGLTSETRKSGSISSIKIKYIHIQKMDSFSPLSILEAISTLLSQ